MQVRGPNAALVLLEGRLVHGEGEVDEGHNRQRAAPGVEPFDLANPVKERDQLKRGTRDIVAAFENTVDSLPGRSNVEDAMAVGVSIGKRHDRADCIVDRSWGHIIAVVADAEPGEQAALDDAVFALQFVVASLLGIRPNQTQAEQVTRNAPLAGGQEELLGNPFARDIAI